MNFEFAEIINPYLARGEFTQAIQLAENRLASIPSSPFHEIIGQSLLGHTDKLCCWIDDFHRSGATTQPVRALYFELTEFDINTDEWAIDGFAYSKDYGLEDSEWLSDWGVTSVNAFVLEGYEYLQLSFEEVELDSEDLQNAYDWCEQLVIARYMELVQATHKQAQLQGLTWARLPVYYTEHGYDFILRS